jgi:glycerophosphoryl diester phosphodiesterase
MIRHQLIAHRGWRNRYPENTLIGIEAALEQGAKHIEIDIQISANGVAMLCHDQELSRLCASSVNINQVTTQQLEQLSVYEPERLGQQFLSTPLSPLSECISLLASHPEATLYIELKQESIDSFGSQAVLDAVMPLAQLIKHHCYLISFNTDILELAQAMDWTAIAPVLHSYEQSQSPAFKTLSPPLVFCDHKLLKSPQHLSSIDYPVAIYEITDHQEAKTLLNQGAALIETFRIGELIQEDISKSC